MTKKIFISLPFTGVADTLGDRLESLQAIVAEAQQDDSENEYQIITQENIVDIIREEKSVPKDEHAYWMGKDIQLVLESDIVLFGYGYYFSKGCMLEYCAASIFNKEKWFQGKDGTLSKIPILPILNKNIF